MLDVMGFGYDMDDSISRPRFHHQLIPNILQVENEFSDDLVKELQLKGHKVEKSLPHRGAVQVNIKWSFFCCF